MQVIILVLGTGLEFGLITNIKISPFYNDLVWFRFLRDVNIESIPV